tara:strand:+ start:67 stop:225 length:159 start_codon:yes stop_codon:yes gene_type:complete
MEQLLSEILTKVETIDELHDEDDDMQVVIDELWALVRYEKHKLYLDSLWEVK